MQGFDIDPSGGMSETSFYLIMLRACRTKGRSGAPQLALLRWARKRGGLDKAALAHGNGLLLDAAAHGLTAVVKYLCCECYPEPGTLPEMFCFIRYMRVRATPAPAEDIAEILRYLREDVGLEPPANPPGDLSRRRVVLEACSPNLKPISATILHSLAWRYGFSRADIVHEADSEPLFAACWNGDLNLLRSLKYDYGCTPDNFTGVIKLLLENWRDAAATPQERAEVWKALRQDYALWLSDHLLKGAIRATAISGGVEEAKVLHAEYGLAARHVRAWDSITLREVCRRTTPSGAALLKFFREVLGTTAADARVLNSQPLRFACQAGNGAAVHYLAEGYGLGLEDLVGVVWALCRSRKKRGHLGVLQSLHRDYGLGAEAFTAGNCAPVQLLAHHNQADLLSYLFEEMGLSRLQLPSLGGLLTRSKAPLQARVVLEEYLTPPKNEPVSAGGIHSRILNEPVPAGATHS